MDDILASRILASIEADRLVAFCGAGLSMASPSDVPGVAGLFATCVPKYEQIIGMQLPAHAKASLEELAKYALGRHELPQIFIHRVIDWYRFIRNPNKGHRAIADLLACKALCAGVTTNVDPLVEQAATDLGEPHLFAALDGNEASVSCPHAPFLKLHGCCNREKDNTVWCKEQLDEDPLKRRIKASKDWMAGNLLTKDIIFVGFWSDWSYLNSIFEDCIATFQPGFIVLVDPNDQANLETKAPGLWGLAHRNEFFHVQESGAVFFDELRRRFSKKFLDELVRDSITSYQGLTGNVAAAPVSFDLTSNSEDLYALRRDACGEPIGQIPRLKRPDRVMNIVGVAHQFLVQNGGSLTGASYNIASKTVRVVLGSGQALSRVEAKFEAEPTTPLSPEVVICAGAFPDAAPVNILRGSPPPTVVRAGSRSKWVTFDQAKTELGL